MEQEKFQRETLWILGGTTGACARSGGMKLAVGPKFIPAGFRFLALVMILAFGVEVRGALPGGRPSSDVPALPQTAYAYTGVELPNHFPGRRRENTPRSNRVTDHGATLGRVLFYDKRLSSNGKISCATCHRAENAFADPRRLSRGTKGLRGKRNAQGLANASFHPTGRFFWDERAATLEEQVLMPIQDPKEMNADLEQVVLNLSNVEFYEPLFTDAFGSPEVTSERISLALAQFIRSMLSYRSKFDVGMAQTDSIHEDFFNFTDEENEGKLIFIGRAENVRGSCASCHLARSRRGRGDDGIEGKFAIFMGPQPQNNGLDRKVDDKDNGVGDLTGDESDMGLFKSPSLRNVELTAPYMHDGRLKTLADVLDHYSSKVKAHPNLHSRLAGRFDGTPRQMNLTSSQKRALIAFLKTLTDHEFVKDPRFSDPFK